MKKYKVFLTAGGYNEFEGDYQTGRDGIYYENNGAQIFIHSTLIRYIKQS